MKTQQINPVTNFARSVLRLVLGIVIVIGTYLWGYYAGVKHGKERKYEIHGGK